MRAFFRTLGKAFTDMLARKVAIASLTAIVLIIGVVGGALLPQQKKWLCLRAVHVTNGIVQELEPGSVVLTESVFSQLWSLVGTSTMTIEGLPDGKVRVELDRNESDGSTMAGRLDCSDHDGPIANLALVKRLWGNHIVISALSDDRKNGLEIEFAPKHEFIKMSKGSESQRAAA